MFFDIDNPDHNWNVSEGELAHYLGPLYRPQGNFTHGTDVEVARIPKQGDDGQDVVIYECRLPAQFYTIVAEAVPERTFPYLGVVPGKPRVSYTTGSGRRTAKLVAEMALALADGMLSARETP
jgi:hypothetical protein